MGIGKRCLHDWRVTTAIVGVGVACAASPLPSPMRTEMERVVTPKVEFFILPIGFHGPVLAIYGQHRGSKSLIRNDTAFYYVPQNGIVAVADSEPGGGTIVRVAFVGRASSPLDRFEGCDEMRVALASDLRRIGVCWLEDLGGSHIPDHIAFLATDWAHIPPDYNRGMALVDSVLFHGLLKGGPQWVEPKALPKASRRSADRVVTTLNSSGE